MTTYIALLRGINLGKHKRVAMADLRNFMTQLGCLEVRTVLQSGNVVFQSSSRSSATLERQFEAAAAEYLGFATDFFVRAAGEWAAIVADNPFPREAAKDPAHLLVTVLRKAPSTQVARAMQSRVKGPEVARLVGRQLYVVYPNGIGRSTLSHTSLERTLGTSGTARNWNTVLKLDALANGG